MKQADRAKPALDGLQFHDQSRFRSTEVVNAFAAVIRAASLGPQLEVSEPDEVMLEPDDAISDMEIVRGVD